MNALLPPRRYVATKRVLSFVVGIGLFACATDAGASHVPSRSPEKLTSVGTTQDPAALDALNTCASVAPSRTR